MSILVTGGLGYIGSHAVIELIEKGEEVIILDNLVNSEIETLDRIENITKKPVLFYQVDLMNVDDVLQVFNENTIKAVMHFAGLKAVNESIYNPINYYSNNIIGTINLCEVMKKKDVKTLIFSSSATVYGVPRELPITEEADTITTNPYGNTKLMIENILQDICKSDPEWSIFILRYFNPIGAHKSSEIGEKPIGLPNNLMPHILKVATGESKYLKIYGNDYNTKDGTAIRDYIHVVDLVNGHIKALEKSREKKGVFTYNLGTGKGYSVLEIVQAFEKISGLKINYTMVQRRKGDVPVCFANTHKAEVELEWSATKDIEEMCLDAWNWERATTRKTIF